MALELVGGAVLGAALAQLLKVVIDAKDNATNFQQALTRLESTLRSVIPRVNEICWLNHELNVPDEEMEKLVTILQNGQALVYKCSKISSINFVRKVKYSKELLELDYCLLRYFQTTLPLDQLKVAKEMLGIVRELHTRLVGAKDKSSEPDEGKSSKPKVDEYSEIKSEPDEEGESSKPKVDECSEIKSEPDEEGESSKPKVDEYSEIQSCQDPEKKETLFEKMLLMMRGLHMGHVGAKDEGESSKSKEDESSQEPDKGESSKPKGDEYSGKNNNLELVIKIEDQIISSPTLFNDWRWNKLDTWTFRLKGCTYIFGPEEYSINYDEKILYQEMGTNYVANCQCKKRHGYVMVSRIEKVRIGKSEFEQQMETSGRIGNHPNIVPPFGYCFYQSELFLFYDSFPKGAGKGVSLYTRLHGYSWRVANPDSPPLRSAPREFSWESKLKISLGVARGIAHLHSVKCSHGNLHSYNVLLNSDDGCISDYGLLNFSSAAKQSDVYSFGVILLEMLSETDPSDFEEYHHQWVEEIARVQKINYSRTRTLFGKVDKQARKMLKIAMLCVQKDLDKRPEMDNVVKKIQKIQTSCL